MTETIILISLFILALSGFVYGVVKNAKDINPNDNEE